MSRTRKKIFWYVAIMLALFLLLGGCAVLFYKRIVFTSSTVKEAEGEIAVLERKERDLDNNKKKLEDLGDSLVALEGSFVSKQSFVQFVELIERLAQDAGVVFRAQEAELPASPKEKANLRFEVQGSYAALTKFFILFDAIPYAGLVEELRMTPLGEKTEALRASVTFTIFNFIPTP